MNRPDTSPGVEALARRYDTRVPRYTSYPTAPHFHAVAGDEWYRDRLAALRPGSPVSLYLHIPFCRAMCWYCGCHTRVAKDDVPVAAYVAALRREIDLVAAAIGPRVTVRHIHWGGGTPTLLSPATFLAIARDLAGRFDLAADAEHAVEADPRTLSGEQVEALAAAGVTRVSLGVQTLSESIQHRINRIQPFAEVAGAVESLRRSGIGALNVDLMYGLPTQTAADVAATVDAVATLAPSRLALFGYAHVPWMKPHQQRIDEAELPGAAERLRQLLAGADRLALHGYRRIGMDHFARASDALAHAAGSGRLRRNFQGYTDDQSPVLIGLGASSIGELPQGYAQNAVAIPDWRKAVFAGRLPVARMRELTAEDRLRRAVIERLMCDMAVDVEAVLADRGWPADHLDEALARLEGPAADGLVSVSQRRVQVADGAWPFVRSIAAAFDAYLAPSETRHARAI
jgi:oxygen-independent coproporphyrinogen-3 oxidase